MNLAKVTEEFVEYGKEILGSMSVSYLIDYRDYDRKRPSHRSVKIIVETGVGEYHEMVLAEYEAKELYRLLGLVMRKVNDGQEG